MKSIDRYMARLIVVPPFSTLVIFAMLLVLARMPRLFDFVATEGGPISVAWRTTANRPPEPTGGGVPVGRGPGGAGGSLGVGVKECRRWDGRPRALCIATLGGVVTQPSARNTTIPTRKSETFSTAAASQTSVEVKVFQGERSMAKDNRLLGVFQLVVALAVKGS